MHPVSPRAPAIRWPVVVLLCSLSSFGCGEAEPGAKVDPRVEREKEAVRRVAAIDDAFARIRDKATGRDVEALHAAGSRYVESLAAIDLSDVPDDVRTAYARHLTAWQKTLAALHRYTGLSGAFRKGLEGEGVPPSILEAKAELAATWDGVKAAAKAHGVAVTRPTP